MRTYSNLQSVASSEVEKFRLLAPIPKSANPNIATEFRAAVKSLNDLGDFLLDEKGQPPTDAQYAAYNELVNQLAISRNMATDHTYLSSEPMPPKVDIARERAKRRSADVKPPAQQSELTGTDAKSRVTPGTKAEDKPVVIDDVKKAFEAAKNSALRMNAAIVHGVNRLSKISDTEKQNRVQQHMFSRLTPYRATTQDPETTVLAKALDQLEAKLTKELCPPSEPAFISEQMGILDKTFQDAHVNYLQLKPFDEKAWNTAFQTVSDNLQKVVAEQKDEKKRDEIKKTLTTELDKLKGETAKKHFEDLTSRADRATATVRSDLAYEATGKSSPFKLRHKIGDYDIEKQRANPNEDFSATTGSPELKEGIHAREGSDTLILVEKDEKGNMTSSLMSYAEREGEMSHFLKRLAIVATFPLSLIGMAITGKPTSQREHGLQAFEKAQSEHFDFLKERLGNTGIVIDCGPRANPEHIDLKKAQIMLDLAEKKGMHVKVGKKIYEAIAEQYKNDPAKRDKKLKDLEAQQYRINRGFLEEESRASETAKEKMKSRVDIVRAERAEAKSISQQIYNLKEAPKLDDAKAVEFKNNLKDPKTDALKTAEIKTALDAGAERLKALQTATKLFTDKVNAADPKTLPAMQAKLDELYEEIKRESNDLQKRAEACRDVITLSSDVKGSDQKEGGRPPLPAGQDALLKQAEDLAKDAKKENDQANENSAKLKVKMEEIEKAAADAKAAEDAKKASAPSLNSGASNG